MPMQPIHHLGDVSDCFTRGNRWPVDHDDGQAEGAGGSDFGDSTLAAGILGDKDLCAMIAHQIAVACKGEGAARNDDARLRQGQWIGGRIDETQQVMVLRLAGEGLQMLAADREEDAAWGRAKGCGGGGEVWCMGPVVTIGGRPGRAFEGNQGQAHAGAGGDGMGAHLRGERVGRIDDMGDVFHRQIGHQPCDAAKAAQAHGQGLRHGIFRTARIGIDGIGIVIMQRAGEKPRLGRAAEQKDAHHG